MNRVNRIVDIITYSNELLCSPEHDVSSLFQCKKMIEDMINEYRTRYDTHAQFMDKYIDMPGYEHLIEASHQNAPTCEDIAILEGALKRVDDAIKLANHKEGEM